MWLYYWITLLQQFCLYSSSVLRKPIICMYRNMIKLFMRQMRRINVEDGLEEIAIPSCRFFDNPVECIVIYIP